ncbi:MAG: MOSC domain-containing protein [Planctomycetes bacterium]|nr:MOSC domain-containing protein [Planctomycetota bacterium]
MRSVDAARAVADQGLEGDHAVGGRRQITLLALESWLAACAEFGGEHPVELDPGVRRANLLVEGLDLGASIGGRIAIGEVVIEVLGETRPCELMDDDGRLGLQAALRPQRRGGVFGRIVAGGELRVGMVSAIV